MWTKVNSRASIFSLVIFVGAWQSMQNEDLVPIINLISCIFLYLYFFVSISILLFCDYLWFRFTATIFILNELSFLLYRYMYAIRFLRWCRQFLQEKLINTHVMNLLSIFTFRKDFKAIWQLYKPSRDDEHWKVQKLGRLQLYSRVQQQYL